MRNCNRRPKNKGNPSRKETLVGPVGTVTVPRSLGMAAFPVALRTKLRYFFTFNNGTGAALAYAEYAFRSNSLFDPDYTGIGSQPAGFAALATLYGKYRVLSADVTCTIANDAGGTTSVVFWQRDTTSSYANLTTAVQQGFAKTALLSDQSGGKNQHTFKAKIKPWTVLGVTKERYMIDDQYAAAVTASPAQVSYFGFGLSAITIAANAQHSLCVVFDAVLFDRVNLA